MSEPTFEIRAYTPEHVRATAELWLESWRSIGLDTSDAVPVESLVERIAFEIEAGWSAWLAWEGDRLVGFVALKPAIACLDQIFVAPDAKGAGRGTRLLQFAKAQMPTGFWLRAAAENTVARRFYEKHGLVAGEVEPHPRFGHPTVVHRWPGAVATM